MAVRIVVKSAVEGIASDLRERLFSGDLQGSGPLTESEIAATYEVARATAKASIEKLVAEGLLIRGANKSARVPVMDSEDVSDIYRARALLESEALRVLAESRATVPEAENANLEISLARNSPLAIVEPDMRFHASLVNAIGSPRASRMYESLVSEVRLCMSQVQGKGLLSSALIYSEHARILEFVAAGKSEAAVTLLHEHLGRAREKLIDAIDGVAGPEAQLDFSKNV